MGEKYWHFRRIFFTLRNAANGDMIGEADIFYSHLVVDGRANLKVCTFNNINLFLYSKFLLLFFEICES